MARPKVSRERTRERGAKPRTQPRDFLATPSNAGELASRLSKSNNLYLNLRSYWRVQKQLRFGFVYHYRALKSVHSQHQEPTQDNSR